MENQKERLLLNDKYNSLALRVENKLEEIVQYVVFENEEVAIFNKIWDYYFNTQSSDDLNKEINIAIRDYYVLLGIEHQNQLRLKKSANKC